jgi:sulfatase maturation enzyme AslB (radical SAM superfamily)
VEIGCVKISKPHVTVNDAGKVRHAPALRSQDGLPIKRFSIRWVGGGVQHPELLHDLDADDIAAHNQVLSTGKRHWPPSRILENMRGWMVPYLKSRVLPGDFQPIIAYLFTEWKCNLDCHYCWSYDNRIKGMTEDTARRAIDWLHSTPCRVLAPTGGEPLLRPDFVHKVIYYAAKKDFWVYLATNARLLRPDVIDHLSDAGIATIQFRGGCSEGKTGTA